MKFAIALISLLAPLSAQTFGTSDAGAGCGGATLTITFTPVGNGGNSRIDIVGEGLHPNSVAGMVFGVAPAAIGPVLNLPECFVRTEPIWAQHHLTDANGVMSWSRSWPNSVVGYYLIQLGSLDGNTLDLKLTNCVRAAHE